MRRTMTAMRAASGAMTSAGRAWATTPPHPALRDFAAPRKARSWWVGPGVPGAAGRPDVGGDHRVDRALNQVLQEVLGVAQLGLDLAQLGDVAEADEQTLWIVERANGGRDHHLIAAVRGWHQEVDVAVRIAHRVAAQGA